MSMLGGLLGVGGSLLGGLLGASSASKQARAQQAAAQANREYDEKLYGQNLLGRLRTLLGPEEGLAVARQLLPKAQYESLVGRAATSPTFGPEQQARVASIDREIEDVTRRSAALTGTNRTSAQRRIEALRRQREGLVREAGGDPGVAGSMDMEALRGGGPGLLSGYDTLTSDFAKAGRENERRYGAETTRLGQLARDIEAQAGRFGTQERARIKRDSADALENANRAAAVAAQRKGMGASSMLTDAMRGNAEGISRSTQDALGSLGDRQIALRTGLAGNTLGLLSQRSQGASGLSLGMQDRDMQLRQGGLNTRLGILTSGAMDPRSGVNSSTYFPSASPTASGLGSLAGSLAGIFSPLMGYGLGSLMGGGQNQQYTLEQLRRFAQQQGGMG